ncbi:hypothetical protein [Ramlibacter tataouinensis]|uniref:hypothetical protein n=1 Tax=Ramlibacter tataouinensis TaxID=94132 RepID=UPI00030AFD1C|nr:hypothetical protein [Ramlibacter tataouinensis]
MSRADEPGKAKAGHGYRNEVTWDGAAGRQPYSNQGEEEGAAPNLPPEHAEGDRGSRSGTNLDQLEEVKRKP